MIIKYNGIDVSNRLISYKKSSSFVDNRLIGNVPSNQLEISIENTDQFFDDFDHSFYWSVKEYDSSTEEYFIVYESPEKYTKTLGLKMYDNAYRLDIAYASQLAYPTTIKNQLEEITFLTGFSFNVDVVPNWLLNKEVAWYDTTITIRTYIGWMAELFGTNVFAVGKDSFEFRLLSTYPNLKTDKISQYQKSEMYQLDRICFDDSLNVYQKGNEKGNTLYLDSGNLYIDSQVIIDYLYSLYTGLRMNIVTGVTMVMPENICLGNLINYNDEFSFMLTEIASRYKGGEFLVADVEGSIYTKNEEKQIQKISNDVRIKKINVKMDQEEQRLDIIAQTAQNAKEQTSKLTVSIDEISTSINSLSESIYKIETGSYNIFSNCNQEIEAVDKEVDNNDMPLDIEKDYLRAKDICISVQIDFVNAIVGSGYAGATFDVGYANGTIKTYSCFLYVGEPLLEYTLSEGITNISKRFYTTYTIEDKEITSISNLKIIITAKGEKITVARPKVEFGNYPTGFEYDLQFIRDNITTIQNNYSVIEQDIDSIISKVGDTETTITKNYNDITTTISLKETEIKQYSDNIVLIAKQNNEELYITPIQTQLGEQSIQINNINTAMSTFSIDSEQIRLGVQSINRTLVGIKNCFLEPNKIAPTSSNTLNGYSYTSEGFLRLGVVSSGDYELYKTGNFNGGLIVQEGKKFSTAIELNLTTNTSITVTLTCGDKTSNFTITNESKIIQLENFELFANKTYKLTFSKNSVYVNISKISLVEGETYQSEQLGIQELNTKVTQNDTTISFVKTGLEQIESDLEGYVTQTDLEEYVRFDGANIELGTSKSNFRTIITNEEIGFYDGATKVAYVSNNTLMIVDAIVKNTLRIGNFVWKPRANGNLSLVYNKEG